MGRRSSRLRTSTAVPLASIAALAALLASAASAQQQNLVLVILDDIGVDRIGAYGGPDAAPTPNIDALAAAGVRFDRFWAQPVCSPFRASVLTGLEPWQHGVGSAISNSQPDRSAGLDPTIDTIANRLRGVGYRTEAIGKWHLAGEPYSSPAHPLFTGFQHHRGLLGNPADDEGGTYFQYMRCIDGRCRWRTQRPYLTTDTTNDAITALGKEEPFFLWVAYNGVHAPIHNPPAELTSIPPTICLANPANKVTCSKAMTEALDRELGRLFASIDWSDTTVVLVADNGTPAHALGLEQIEIGKGTLLESGLRTPLIVRGNAVAPPLVGTVSSALVQATDLFATLLELAGESGAPPTSISFAPQLASANAPPGRQHAFAETFAPNGETPAAATRHQRAVRDDRYKLIERRTEDESTLALYDLGGETPDLSESNNLLAQNTLDANERDALQSLTTALATTGALPVPSPSLAGPLGTATAAALLALGVASAQRAASRSRHRTRD